MMTGSSMYISRTYAAALFELAAQAQLAETVKKDMSMIQFLAASEKEFAMAVASPYFSREYKGQLLRKLFVGQVTDLTMDFLQIVSKHERLTSLSLIAVEYEKLLDVCLGRCEVTVTLAKAIGENEIEKIKEGIAAALKSEVKLTVRIDPDIIGGIIIRTGDKVVDNSVKKELRQAVGAITDRQKNRKEIHEV